MRAATVGAVDRRHAVGVGADRDQFEAEFVGQHRDVVVGGGRVVELGHRAEHGHSTVGPHGGERSQRGRHRRRIGVVGVVDDHSPVGGRQRFHPTRRQSRRADGRGRRCQVDADDAGHRQRGGGVGDHVLTRYRQRHRTAAPRRVVPEPRPRLVVQTHLADPHRGGGRRSERDHGRRRSAVAIAATRGSSALSTAVPAGGRARTSSALARATPSIPPTRSVCDGATFVTTPMVGTGDGGQAGDLAEPAHPHLQHQHVDVVGRPQHGDREALLVVERAIVGGDPPTGADRRRHEVLRRRLAHAAGDADHGGGGRESAARPRRQIHQGRSRVGDLDRRGRHRHIGGSCRQVGAAPAVTAPVMKSCPSRSATIGTNN